MKITWHTISGSRITWEKLVFRKVGDSPESIWTDGELWIDSELWVD